MEKEFVSYEQAVALKELGYNEECLATYVGEVLDLTLQTLNDDYFTVAPLKQQVFRWFRDKYDAHIHPSRLMRNIYVVRYGDWDSEAFKTYEEAENACIDKLISIAKQQDNGN
jgi:hypothetical protein